jgi:predicted nucleic acid-binding protein
MGTLIDSTLWVEYFRARTPLRVKQQVIPFIDDPEAALCEPVRFEILSGALRRERRIIEETFETMPLLAAPSDLWKQSTLLGQRCVDRGVQPRSLDLLIAVICIHHDGQLVTFDTHFAHIAKLSPLNLRLLTRAP